MVWDGTYFKNDNLCPVGIYTYTVFIENIYGEIFEYQGQVKLLRNKKMNFKYIFFLLVFLFTIINSKSQSYSDGPISIDVKLRSSRKFYTDESLLGIGFAPDELVFKIWTQDNLLNYPWTGGNCLQDFNFTPIVGGGNSIDFNTTFNFNFS